MNLRLSHALLLVLGFGTSASVVAQQADRSIIQAEAASHGNGRLAVNQTAGVGNAQVNLMAVAKGNVADGSTTATQLALNPDTARTAESVIEAGAFKGFQGALALNQSSGANTLQANLLVIETREAVTATDDRVLAQIVPGTPPTEGAGSAPEVSREARIDASAFRGASGVLQVNQSAGVGNAATNAVVVRLPATAGGI